jgi:NADPH:quinone reductase
MRAVAYTHCRPITADDALIDMALPDPSPRHRDLLIEVRAVAVNPVDVKLRRRADPVGEPRVLGFDASGIVRAIGPEVARFGIGDQVWYAGVINRPGANAELQRVDARIVGRKPRTLSWAEAAAMPLTVITAWEMLFDRLDIRRISEAGKTLLIIGGAGGVGSMAIQLARQLTSLTIIATASRAETREWCLSLGAHEVIDHSRSLPAELAATGRRYVDYVFGTNASDRHWAEIVRVVAPQGRVGLIDDPESIDARELKEKSVSLHWETMFTRPLYDTADIEEQSNLLNAVANLVDQGKLRTTMTEHFGRITAANMIRAHALIESGRARGKVVLEGF